MKLKIALAALFAGFLAFAQQAVVEKVVNRDGKMQAQVGGNFIPMTAPVAFPAGILVNTNGAFKVANGKERKLENGHSITPDGMLHSPNGAVAPVFDHYIVKGGRLYVVKDGAAATPVTHNVNLPDGSALSPDAFYRSGGRLSRLVDGQTLRVDGGVIPSVDSVTLKDGKVIVQKDGALIPVTSSITMNDGSRVLANGTLVSFGGQSRKLKEGETVTLPGAVLRR